MRTGGVFRAGWIALAATMGAALAAAADERHADPSKERCIQTYEGSQRLRRDGLLRRARAELVVCGQAACPVALRSDCVRWLDEVDASLPTVVVGARDPAGHETSEVRVHVDGEPVAERLSGKAIPVDPGERAFRFVDPAGRTVERRVTVREGEKNRTIDVDFGAAAEGGSTGPAAPASSGRQAIPPSAWILGGIGVAGLAGFAVLGLRGRARENDLVDTCAPRCPQGDVDAMRRTYLAADLSLGVGLAALGAAAWIVLVPRSDAARPRARVEVVPAASGVAVGFARDL